RFSRDWSSDVCSSDLGDVPVPGDYDGTGHLELAVYRPTTAQWFILGPRGGRAVSFGAPNLDMPVPGDYDGDGKTDMAVYRPGARSEERRVGEGGGGGG